jgi:hypothetical protein
MSSSLPKLPNTGLSDLFFNYEHPIRDALYSSRGTPTKRVRDVITEQEEHEALVHDAADFIGTLAAATDTSEAAWPLPGALADDFLARL